jgi:hypothetical protein
MRLLVVAALLAARSAPPAVPALRARRRPFVTFCEADADCALPETCCGAAFRICCDAGGTGQRLPNVTLPWPVPRPVPVPIPVPL